MAELNESLDEMIQTFEEKFAEKSGLLDADYLNSGYTLNETRVLLELNKAENCSCLSVAKKLKIDKSYFSRIIKRFEKAGYISRQKAQDDKRSSLISLSFLGYAEAGRILELSKQRNDSLIKNLTPEQKEAVISAFETLERDLWPPDGDSE
jgi:DNA-binding MarR family transcriptional regulator